MYEDFQKMLQLELDAVRVQGLYKEERILEGPQGAEISVGGKTVASALRLTKAPQSFTVTLPGEFTSVSVVALNEGTSPPNTASFALQVNGRTVKTTKWGLKKHDMGSTVIRRGGN